ncbi:MAG: 2-dehydro-3-deoxyphosphooctonate aldolase [Bacteroidia bacterium]
MKTNTIYLLSCFILVIISTISCKTQSYNSSYYQSTSDKTANGISTDKTYGYTQENPICVGNQNKMGGPLDEKSYLNSIKGPNGEDISYVREGSCCPFKSKNGLMGSGLLDIYTINYAGLDEPITLYINMYDSDELEAPVGFTLAK